MLNRQNHCTRVRVLYHLTTRTPHIGWIFGWIISIVGCVISFQADLPTGATVVCTFGLALAVATLMRRFADG